MTRFACLGVAALLAAAGCVGDVPPDASLSDPAHPANPHAPAATRQSWDDPLAAPTSAPATVPMAMPDMPGMHHGEMR